jgi:hypothetical protein
LFFIQKIKKKKRRMASNADSPDADAQKNYKSPNTSKLVQIINELFQFNN